MFMSWSFRGDRDTRRSEDAIGQRGLDLRARVKGAEHRDRFDGRQSERGRHVSGNARKSEHLDVHLFTGGFDRLKIGVRIVPEAELQRVTGDRLPDFLAMSSKADCGLRSE